MTDKKQINAARWSHWWFINGGGIHFLWKSKRYSEIKALAEELPKLAWDEQQKKIDKYEDALQWYANWLPFEIDLITQDRRALDPDKYTNIAREALK